MDSRPWFFISHIDADGYMSMANMYVTIMKSLDSHCTLETDFSNPDLFMNINYPTEFPIDKLPENANVVITDTCFTTSTLNVLLDIIDKSNYVYWIDHHKSSLEILNDIKDIDKLDFLIRMDMSATKLTYLIMDYFKNTIVCNVHNCLINAIKYITTYKLPSDDILEDIPAPIELIDDYDIWLHKKGIDTWYMHYALEYYGKSIYIEFADDIWYSGPNRRNLKYNTGRIHYSGILEIGKIIYNYKKINNKEIVKNAFVRNFYYNEEKGFVPVLCLNARGNSSTFGDEFDKYPFVLLFRYDENEWKYSVYCSKPFLDQGYDSSIISKGFGGGGHTAASGFTTTKLIEELC